MTITLELKPETQRKLEVLAAKKGQGVADYVNEIVEKTVQTETAVHAGMAFDEVLEPFRQGFEQSGMTEEELEEFLESELKAVRSERWARKQAHG